MVLADGKVGIVAIFDQERESVTERMLFGGATSWSSTAEAEESKSACVASSVRVCLRESIDSGSGGLLRSARRAARREVSSGGQNSR